MSNRQDRTEQSRRYDAVIFDMDGTIIESSLDFTAIRAELGVGPGQGILEVIDTWPPQKRSRAHRHLLKRELHAAGAARLVPHAAETIQTIRNAGMKTALLTRNARKVVEMVLEKFGLQFDLAWSREDGPIKPEPTGVLRACGAMGVRPERTACVGDFRYDIIAANAAGAVSVLLAPAALPDFASEARHVISSLSGLPPLLGI